MGSIALALPDDLARGMERQAGRHGHGIVALAASAADLVRLISVGDCDAAIVAATPRFLGPEVLAAADVAGVRVVGIVRADADRRFAASLGLHELASSDADWAEIDDLLFGAVPPAPDPDPVDGSVIVVWGPAGSPGRTTIAIGIAAEIAAAGYSVAIADVDTYSGSVAPALGLLDESPGFAAACRLAGSGALDRAELERIGQRYLSGHGSVWVLTGIGRPSRWPELSGGRVTATLQQCRRWVDYTVVDTGFSLEDDEEISSDLFAPRRNGATLAALREADHVVAVGSADPVGLSRFLRAYVDLVEIVVAPRVSVLMNRVRAGAIGVNPAAQVTQALRRFGGIDSAVLVPDDTPALDAAVLTGRSLRDTAMRSPARVAIGAFVRSRVLPESEPAPTRRSLRERRRGRSSPAGASARIRMGTARDPGGAAGVAGSPDVVR